MKVRHYGSFSELVKAIRQENRMSQRALAKALRVSPGYVGQWELRLSQPSAEVTVKLCRTFSIDDIEYVQRLAYAGRAPEWLRDSIIHYVRDPSAVPAVSPVERRILDAARRLPESHRVRLAERVEGWVEGLLEAEKPADNR